jgi:ubiquinone/menaquinone biosynthesis C-methylase UbiE
VAQTDIRAVLREQREYYRARATEYDDAYRRTGQYNRGEAVNAGWQADLARLVAVFESVPMIGDVVELAAGTGFWTERLVSRTRSLTVIDGSAGMLATNRERLGPTADRVSYEVADLFEWHPRRSWDACVFGFWLCHVPDDRVAGFLNTVAESLRPGGMVCFVDKAVASEPATERETRTLNNGRQFTIIEHPRPTAQLLDLFAAAGLNIKVQTIADRFCLGRGNRS